METVKKRFQIKYSGENLDQKVKLRSKSLFKHGPTPMQSVFLAFLKPFSDNGGHI